MRRIADARPGGLVLIINPQWNPTQISCLSLLTLMMLPAHPPRSESYIIKQLRMNSDDVRLLYSYPSPWQVNRARPDAPAQVGQGGTAAMRCVHARGR